MFKKMRDICAREEIRSRLVIGIVSLIVLVYALIIIFGHSLPAESPNMPWILRVHPERILAMVAAVLGSVRLADHFQKGENPVPPLLWIFCASLLHLTSVGLQHGWFSVGRS